MRAWQASMISAVRRGPDRLERAAGVPVGLPAVVGEELQVAAVVDVLVGQHQGDQLALPLGGEGRQPGVMPPRPLVVGASGVEPIHGKDLFGRTND
jgi:hypothetical protein